LARDQKRLRILAFTAKFERTEILVPLSLGYVGLRFHPKTKLVEILQAYMAVVHALDQMVPKRDWESGPDFNLRHLLTEDESSHLIAQLLYLFRIGGRSKSLCQGEEGFFLFLLRFQALFDQFDQHAIVAETPFSGDTLDLLGQSCG